VNFSCQYFIAVLGIIPATVNRERNKQFFFIFGMIWVIIGIILSLASPVGYVFSILGMVYITIGVYKWKKIAPEAKSKKSMNIHKD